MKRKFSSNSELAHVWANNVQSEGTASNMFFYGDKIYSYGYHFCIAKRVTNENGAFILFTERRYSSSTAKHVAYVRQAIHETAVFVPDPDNSVSKNFRVWEQKADNIILSLAKAKKPEIYINELNQLELRVKRYSKFLNVPVPETLTNKLNTEDIESKISGAKTKLQALKEEAKQLQKRREEIFAEDLKEWRNFEKSSINNPTEFDYLRYSANKKRLETSKGTEIPLEIARSFFHQISKIIASGGCTNCGFNFMNHYPVKEINNKFIVVGCHKISIEEVNFWADNLKF